MEYIGADIRLVNDQHMALKGSVGSSIELVDVQLGCRDKSEACLLGPTLGL